jgi:hypothetical protein
LQHLGRKETYNETTKDIKRLFEICETSYVGPLSLFLKIGRGLEDLVIKMLVPRYDNIWGNTQFEPNNKKASQINLMH